MSAAVEALPVAEPSPFDGWTAIVILPLPEHDKRGRVGSTSNYKRQTSAAERSTIVLLDDGTFAEAWRRGCPPPPRSVS